MPEIIVETIIDAPKELVWENLTKVENFPLYLPLFASAKGNLGKDKTLKASIRVGKISFPIKVWIKDYQELSRFSWGEPPIKLLSWFMSSEHYFVIEQVAKNKTKLIQGEKVSGLFARPALEPTFKRLASPYFSQFNIGLKQYCESIYVSEKT